jgi:hypothetical protein
MTKPETRLMKIAQKYENILSNGRVLSNRAAVDTLDARIIQLANRIEENDMPQRMAVLNETWHEFREAYDRDKRSDMVVAIRNLDEYFEKTYHDYAAWNQLVEIFDVRRKLVDSEVKTIKEIKALLTAEDAYNLVAKLLAICIRVVQDPVKLRIIQFEFSKVIGEEKLEKPGGVTIDIDGEYDDEIEE